MGFFDVTKAILIPALIALALYLLLAHALAPLYTRYLTHHPYLPLPQAVSATLTTLFDRFTAAFPTLSHRLRLRRRASVQAEEAFGAEEGEQLVGFDFEEGAGARRERQGGYGVARQVSGQLGLDSARRLSRDLEEGFRDSSEESEGEGGRGGGARAAGGR